jgi:hypothetical protein
VVHARIVGADCAPGEQRGCLQRQILGPVFAPAKRTFRTSSCVKGRFKCQATLDDGAVVAAMVYVDLNSLRANMCDRLEASGHTSARQRITEIEAEPDSASHAFTPVLGIKGLSVLRMSQAENLGSADFVGRHIRADKHGVVVGASAAVVARMGLCIERWAHKVMEMGSGFARAVGDVDNLIEKAKAMGQFWKRGVGTAWVLVNTCR